MYPSAPGGPVAATVNETTAFLDAYRRHRPDWSRTEIENAWAADLWIIAYNAKKELLGGGSGYLEHVERELDQRLRRAGL